MKLLQSCMVAFSMYSKIPMPRVDWNKENMKYALCFFPLIGIVIGGLVWAWMLLASRIGFGPFLTGVVASILPIMVTGGIHLDGYCDTSDALASHQSRERKLEILKDSHIGAFALIRCGCYLLLSAACWSEISASPQLLAVLGLGFCLSRSLSGLAAVSFRNARGSGTLATFSSAAETVLARTILLLMTAACTIGMVVVSLPIGSACVIAAGITFAFYRVMSDRQFGGITGDLAGYFLTLCELSMVAAAAVIGRLW